MKQILLAYGLPKETITTIMMLYKNTTVKFQSPDGNTDYFDIVAGILQGGTLAPYLFIICLDYLIQMSIDLTKENAGKGLDRATGRDGKPLNTKSEECCLEMHHSSVISSSKKCG